MFDFMKRIFCSQKNDHWQRDMFTIPYLEEVVITTELSRGLGRRLSCYSMSQTVIVVKQESRADIPEIPEITRKRQQKSSTRNESSSGQSVACEENQGKKKKLTLAELKKLSPPGYKEFEAAVGSKDLDEQTALQLWEDIFKPLDTFELLNIV